MLSDNNFFSLSKKVAIVTGGAGILGREFSKTLSKSGCTVALIDLESQLKSNSMKEFLAVNHDLPIHTFSCDITSPNQVSQVVSLVEKELGLVTILVNNAATKTSNLEQFFTKFEDYDLKTWRDVMSVNVDAVFLMSQAIGRRLVAKHSTGSLIQISSIYGLVGPHHEIYQGSSYLGGAINTPAIYSASKSALIGLTKYLATYWGEVGIRVNCLTPGGIESGQNDVFSRKYSNLVPLNRMGDVSELQGALLFLASEASSYVSGQNIVVDGGFVAW